MAATIQKPTRGALYRDAIRPDRWGRCVGETLEGDAMLVRGDDVFVVPVARLRRKMKPKTNRVVRTLKERRNGWSRGEHVEMNWFA